MTVKTHFCLSALCSSLAACSTPQAVHDLTETQAGILNSYRTSLQSVTEQQTRLNADNERRLHDLTDLRTHNEAYVSQRLMGFTVTGDKAASEIYGALTARSASDLIGKSAAIAELTPAPAAPRAAFDPAEVNALVKAIKAAGVQSSSWDRFKDTFAYAKDVKAAYEKSLDQATKDTDGAKKASETTTGAAANALAVKLEKRTK